MNKLIAANFMRLKKSKVFWACIGFMSGFAVMMQIFNYRDMLEGTELTLESDLFVFATFIGIAAAVFASLFIGTEYSDGTIRNKVIIGHNRRDIYLSNFITAAAVSMTMCIAYMAVYSLIGVGLIGKFTSDLKMILVQLLCVLVLSAACAAIFTLLAMLNHNKAASSVICVLLAFGILFAGSYIHNRLEEPETYEGYYMDESGQLQLGEPEKNPRYLSGTKRQVFLFADDFLPGGQQLQIGSGGAAEPWKLMGYSVIITAGVTAAGVLLFRRKDLK